VIQISLDLLRLISLPEEYKLSPDRDLAEESATKYMVPLHGGSEGAYSDEEEDDDEDGSIDEDHEIDDSIEESKNNKNSKNNNKSTAVKGKRHICICLNICILMEI
jgi:hypothetical protein